MRCSVSDACLCAVVMLLVSASLLACKGGDLPTERTKTIASVAALTRLSQHGVYADLSTRKPARSALEYEPQYPLFSDFADKRRWLLLPSDTQVDTSDMDHWRFPLGTKVVKEFS